MSWVERSWNGVKCNSRYVWADHPLGYFAEKYLVGITENIVIINAGKVEFAIDWPSFLG